MLAAIGMSRPQRAASAAIRAIPGAAGAAVIAGATAVATSTWTPIGLARRAEIDPGVRLDAVPLAIGLPIIAAFVVAAFVVPTSAAAAPHGGHGDRPSAPQRPWPAAPPR